MRMRQLRHFRFVRVVRLFRLILLFALRYLSICGTTLYLACTHDMSLLWHPKQQQVWQEFAVS